MQNQSFLIIMNILPPPKYDDESDLEDEIPSEEFDQYDPDLTEYGNPLETETCWSECVFCQQTRGRDLEEADLHCQICGSLEDCHCTPVEIDGCETEAKICTRHLCLGPWLPEKGRFAHGSGDTDFGDMGYAPNGDIVHMTGKTVWRHVADRTMHPSYLAVMVQLRGDKCFLIGLFGASKRLSRKRLAKEGEAYFIERWGALVGREIQFDG